MYVYPNIEARSCNHFSSGEAVRVTQPVFMFVALGMQHAMRMRHFVTCGLPRPYNIFSTLSHKRHDFRKKNIKSH